jgi:hypothetical protein
MAAASFAAGTEVSADDEFVNVANSRRKTSTA